VGRKRTTRRQAQKELSEPGKAVWTVWFQTDEENLLQLAVEKATYLAAWKVLAETRERRPYRCGIVCPRWDRKG